MTKIKTRQDLIKAYVEYFKKQKHKHIPSASLIPENDPTVLFTTAGMHPLVPFLMGLQKHPSGNRIVNVQKCIRTNDIDEVGDPVHHTFFEMLGNWSIGDYWKKEAITYTLEFYTKALGIPIERLAITCFKGDKNAPKDEESAKIWESLGIPKEKIAFLPKTENWWGPAGETGPCGPDTEIFYCTSPKPPKKFDPSDPQWVEIGNDVLMQYNKDKRLILVDGMHCLYDKNFNLNKELLELVNSFNTHTVLTVNGSREKGYNLVKNYDQSRDTNWKAFSLEEDEINKDNPKYFEKLLKTFNLKPEEVMYFDHNKKNVETAESLGILSQHYTGIKQIKKFLEKDLWAYIPLKQKNIDFGGGLERTITLLNGLEDNYESPIFAPIIKEIESISKKSYSSPSSKKPMRIIADHVKAAAFILGDPKGIKPSNLGQGYVLRRLIRRAIRYGKLIGIQSPFLSKVAKSVIPIYPDYTELKRNHKFITQELDLEESRFSKTLLRGLQKFNSLISDKKKIITGKEAFLLFQSFGFPIEMTQELANEKSISVDLEEYNKEFAKHQDLSRTLSSQQFKSGLADNSEQTRRLHTATHLLNEAIRVVLKDPNIKQKGSNITPERLRFDFNFPRKLTPNEISQIESLVNEKISQALEVKKEEFPLKDAIKSGAQAEFGAKYPDMVYVYTILDPKDPHKYFSKEICTGPHVNNTSQIQSFKITKEESSAAGIRRIKAIVEGSQE